jgi:hypothetical protein
VCYCAVWGGIGYGNVVLRCCLSERRWTVGRASGAELAYVRKLHVTFSRMAKC